jgi:chromosome segregation ATPase
MKALSKGQGKEKADLIDGVRTAHAELETAIGTYNEALTEEKGKVQEKLDALNAKIHEVKEWTVDLASDMQNYHDEKSERWQEGENGQNYSSWKDGYENLDTDDVEIEFPEDLEVPACAVADDLENLPDEP